MLRNTALLFVSLIFSAILAEIVLRIALPPPIIWKYPQERYIRDTEIGHWLEPGQNTYTHDKPVVTNSIGIRDSEYPAVTPPGVYRILALGDSQTFGNGLDLVDTWPKKLQTQLNLNESDTSVEVLNCGLPGSDTWQHEIILRRMLDHYHPDAVVLAFYINDVVRRFVPKDNRKEAPGPLKTRIIYMMKQSALLLSIRTAMDVVKHKIKPDNMLLREQAIANGEYNSGVEDGWKQVELSLAEMKKLSDSNGIRFLVIALPRRDQVNKTTDQDAYSKRLGDIGARHDIPVLPMLASLQQASMDNELFIPWDGHNSAVANQIIASEITGWLREGRITSQRSRPAGYDDSLSVE